MAFDFASSDAVVIVGGGFAGLTTALSLSYAQPQPPIILIEPRPRFVFLPFLYELLSEELQTWEVAPSYRSLLSNRGIVLIQDLVSSIKTDDQIVVTQTGENFKYSQLVLCTGCITEDFGIQGVNEYALRFQNLEDVDLLKKSIKALATSNQNRKAVAIVGAGSTGVELACKLSDLLDSNTQLHLIELGNRVLPNGRSFNQEQAQQALERRAIQVHLHTRVLSVLEDRIEVKSYLNEGSQSFSLKNNCLIWTAGTKPVIPSGLFHETLKENKLLIDEYLHVIGLKNVMAIGDSSIQAVNPSPATAQVAIQQGQAAAKILMAIRMNQSPKPFEFNDFGEMLSLGIGEATITGLGLTIAGPMAFHIRRMIYLTKMPGLSLGVRSAGAWIVGN